MIEQFFKWIKRKPKIATFLAPPYSGLFSADFAAGKPMSSEVDF